MGIDLRDLDQPIGTLSGGQRQCVAIARAVYFGAKVLILDEPTAALGVKQSGVVLKYIAAARDAGLGVIFITHNPHHAYLVGDHFVLLKLGRVALDAHRDEHHAGPADRRDGRRLRADGAEPRAARCRPRQGRGRPRRGRRRVAAPRMVKSTHRRTDGPEKEEVPVSDLRIGIVGVGVMGADHAERVARHTAGARLVAVSDLDVARAAGACGRSSSVRRPVRVIGDPVDLIAADDVDAGDLASPGFADEEQVFACLEHGKPVCARSRLTMDAASSLAGGRGRAQGRAAARSRSGSCGGSIPSTPR